jgi:hypothetical protein
MRDLDPVIENLGLWNLCTTQKDGTSTCSRIDSSCSVVQSKAIHKCTKLMGARAFITIACILSVFSALFLFSNALGNSGPNHIVSMVSKILPFGCFVTGLSGIALGMSFIKYTATFSISGAPTFGFVALLCNFDAIVFAILIR